MADKRCENGHFIDESWDICPYCPQEVSEPEIAVVRPTRVPESAAAVPVSVPVPIRAATRGGAAAAAAPALVPSPAPPPPEERTVAAARFDQGTQKRYVVGWLIGLNGATRGESFPVRMGRNVIGRDRRSDVVIPDDQASSHHADLVFRPEERRFILMDHNSTNGTYVNESEIEPRRDLLGKDVIRIGSHRFLFMPLCHDGFFWDDEGLLK
ncbi:MAG TPA: FHA domain-containing protein [Thermoanaerobaculia bacterium]|nr:FHA domain-containing protein [Thermoanaerobaculia bacterium]